MTLCVALLGGESSGKSTLAQALHTQLQDIHGLRDVLVPEHLRDWCEARGRAPEVHEQAAIAAEQTRLIRAARQMPGVDVVIADTTALMVAAYSALYFEDDSLLAPALAEHRACVDLNLLMGLDLPWEPDGLFRDSPAVRDATDAWLRDALQGAGIGFQTVYGQGEARVQQALRAVGTAIGRPLVWQDPELTNGLRPWSCENCSDPECEQRLFTGLLSSRLTKRRHCGGGN